MRFFQASSGGLEQPMFPSQLPPTSNPAPASKRKTGEDANLLGNVSKKPRNDSENIPSLNLKRKREEKIGGFVIARGPPRPQTAQDNYREPPRPPSRATQSETEAGPSSSRPRSKPPSASTVGPAFSRPRKKGKERDVSGEPSGEVEEDVRQMNSEADDLRDRSRASMANMTPAAMTVELEFPPPKSTAANTAKSRARQLKEQNGSAYGGVPVAGSSNAPTTPTRSGRDGVMPISQQETPQIAKNKALRGEQRAPPDLATGQPKVNASVGGQSGLSRRRSSMSLRGKRSSSAFEATGIITLPHNTVSDSSFYKHIDTDLPESQRIRQLLIWVASRAMDPSSSSRGRGRKSVASQLPPDVNLPPLPPGGAELIQEVQNEVIRQLAEKKIDTSAFAGGPAETTNSWRLKENEQNVRNKAREKLFTEQIEERKKEDIAWAEVAQFYNAHQSNVLSAIHQRNRASAKAKGKQRATSQEPESLEPWENELPEAFRGSKGSDVAKHLLELGVQGVCKGDPRRAEMQYKEDRLHASVAVARQLTHNTASDLDHRFSLLSISLAQRTLPPSAGASLSSQQQQPLANFVPATAMPETRYAGPDPQDLLRALARTDAARPRSQFGDAARRAAKDVQRARESQAHQAAEGGLGVPERKLTDVPPPTPRKPPGTPKRPTTPGAGRR